jgi:hypothetical protein
MARNDQAEQLRKLAAAVRDEEARREAEAFAKAAHVLCAAKGLLTLRRKQHAT